jgi:hypothetical protein
MDEKSSEDLVSTHPRYHTSRSSEKRAHVGFPDVPRLEVRQRPKLLRPAGGRASIQVRTWQTSRYGREDKDWPPGLRASS